MGPMDIKGLKDKLNLTPEQEERFNRMKIRYAIMYLNVLRRGGNLHGVDVEATRKRRAKNRVARKQRKVNRGR